MAAPAVDPATYAIMVEFNGPVVAATIVYSMLYGTSLVMAFDYYQWYKDDPLVLRLLVLWEMIMCTLHYCFMFDQCWFKAIQGWGDASTLFRSNLAGNLLNITTIFILMPAQCFYLGLAFRALNRNWPFLIVMGCGIALVFAAGFAVGIDTVFLGKTFSDVTLLANMYLWTGLAIDIIIAAVLCVRFRYLQKGAGDVSRSVLWSFMALSVRTSAATTSMALFERLCHATGHGLLAQAPGLILAGVIILSLLHTLNSRKELQARLAGDTTASGPALSRFGRKNTGNGDLNPRSEIRVDTIVLQEIDNADKDGLEKPSAKKGYSRDSPFQAQPAVTFASETSV